MSAVRIEGELTEWFRIKVGVRQGCGLSPELFNLILEIVMRLAEKEGSGTGVKLNGRLLDNLRFADDIDLMADMKENLQTLTNRVDKSSKRMGLKIKGVYKYFSGFSGFSSSREVYKYFSGGVYNYFSGVYKYFSGAGEVYLNTTMAFFCPGKVLDKCRPIYKYLPGFSGAGEVYKYFSGTVYINTSPASRTP